MTKYSIKIGELFGSSYYNYNVYASKYNMKLDTTINVTCQVKNIFGNPIKNKELTLYYKGTAQTTKKTNANGIAEWEINVGDDVGIYRIEVDNHWIFINVTGWKLLETKNNNQIKVYGDGENIAVSIQDSFTLTKDGSRVISTISTEYAPSQILTTPYHPTSPTVMLTINGNGAITVYNPTSATSGIARVYVTYPLKQKMP